MTTGTFVETNALLAVLAGDDDRAQQIVDSMLASERHRLVQAAEKLALIADDSQRCPGCWKPVDVSLSSITVVGPLAGPRQPWHTDCLTASRTKS